MIKPHDSLLVRVITPFMVPFIQVFAFYVLFHGHSSPGGGFQAGVLLGASMLFPRLVGREGHLPSYSARFQFLWASTGILIYAGIGLLALFFGRSFLDYGALEFLGNSEATRRYFGILIIEIGITFAVSMTVVIIFEVLAHASKPHEAEKT